MDIRIEEIGAELGTKGVLIRISNPNGGSAVGRLRVGKAKLEWYPGKTSVNKTTISMDKFINWLNSH